MDMLVAVMLVSGLVGFFILVLMGSWRLFGRARERGWRSCVPTNFSGWNGFWFTPRDPTVLGLIRIACGAITTYTVFSYTFMLQDFMGVNAWYDLPMRLEYMRTRPIVIGPLSGRNYPAAVPTTPKEQAYVDKYKQTWGSFPPGPFPKSEQEAIDLDIFKQQFGYDLRLLRPGSRPRRMRKKNTFPSICCTQPTL